MKILIATDGSEFSRVAVDEARKLVKGYGEKTEIMLVSVFEAPTVATEPFMTSPDYYERIRKSLEELAQGYVGKARASIEDSIPGVSITENAVMGIPGPTIVDIAEEWGADLIIVGSHGRGFWSRALLGSVSDAVINHAPCSVLVVRGSGISEE